MFRCVIGGLVALSIFSSTFCSAALKATPQMTQALMVKSGVNKQVEQIPSLVLYGMDQAYREFQPPLPPEVYEKLRQAVGSSFRADSILRKIQENIETRLNKYDVEAILQWVDSPLGIKITKLEESSSTIGAYQAMESMKEELLKDAGRVKRIRKLDVAIKATESSLELAANTQRAIASAMAAALAPDDPAAFDRIVEKSKAGRKQLESDAKDKTIAMLLYTYRTLKDVEIDAYFEFASSDLGKRYNEVVTDGINSGLVTAARDVGKSFGGTLQ